MNNRAGGGEEDLGRRASHRRFAERFVASAHKGRDFRPVFPQSLTRTPISLNIFIVHFVNSAFIS
jgi:hypothetical protein